MPRRPRDPIATRNAILDAAEAVFSERGFGDASMSGIAARGGVTQSLIHHHFGSKQALWRAVKQRRIGPYLETIGKMIERGGGGVSDMPEGVRALFDLLRENPRLVRIMAWSLAEGPERAAREGMGDTSLIGATVERLRALQREGDFRDDVDPVALFIAYFALTEYWFLRRNALQTALGDELPSDEVYLDTIVKLLARGASDP